MAHCTWEPEQNMFGCEELIEQYDVQMGHKIIGKFLFHVFF